MSISTYPGAGRIWLTLLSIASVGSMGCRSQDTTAGEAQTARRDAAGIEVASRAGDVDLESRLARYPLTMAPLTWAEQQKITASDGAIADLFGAAVALDGDTALVAAADDGAGTDSGSAYVFTRNAGTWSQQQKLTASDEAAYAEFGTSVAIDGDTALVGAFHEGGIISKLGAAYVFTRAANSWTEQQILTASDRAPREEFGFSVALLGDMAVVGALREDHAGQGSGAVYIFSRSAGIWTETQKLTASEAGWDHFFGSSLALDSDTMFIGSLGDDDGGILAGAVYVFTRNASSWTEHQKLVSSDAASADNFGSSAALSNDAALISAPGNDDAGSRSGSAYVFVRNATCWTEQQKLTASDAAAFDEFGSAVTLNGDTTLIGAWRDNDGGNYSGSVYVFQRSATS